MPSTATIKITTPAGEIEFSSRTGLEPPLFSQRVEALRSNDQGCSLQRVNCELSGFFEGADNAAVQAKVMNLLTILQSNEATLYYHDGVREVINRRVWLSNVGDPLEWKQYNSQYAASFYYFREVDHEYSPIAVSYQPSSGPAYSFDPPPSITRSFKEHRKSMREDKLTVGGNDLGEMVQIVLEGILFAETPADLEEKKRALHDAMRLDGTLNYGSFYSVEVRAIEQSIPNVYPQTYLNYSITLGYDTFEIFELEITKSYSRVHNQPLIKEWAYCPQRPYAIQRNLSSQTINYFMKASGYNITDIRNFLAGEALNIVEAGGTELPGGTEEHHLRGGDPSVSVRFSKFYPDAKIANLSNT